MVRLSKLKQDLVLEDEGRWFEHPEFPGARCLIARLGNRTYAEFCRRRRAEVAAENAARKVKGTASDSGLTDEQATAIYHEALSRFVLRGWEGFEDDDGKPLAYTNEAAQKALTDPEFKDFAAWVLRCAAEAAGFRKQMLEDAAGN